ncbi:MAG: hypothetical protein ABIJ91_01985 [Candidatus Kuenenbacteria bacterium]
MIKTKQEKREEQAEKIKNKQKRGATLGGQILRVKTVQKYAGSGKKMIK